MKKILTIFCLCTIATLMTTSSEGVLFSEFQSTKAQELPIRQIAKAALETEPETETGTQAETESTTLAATCTSATSTVATSTSATETSTETTTVATYYDPTEPFELTDELVANKIRDYFSKKGYTDAQIAGIIGNAVAESGLEPSRCVSMNGGFGLFQLFPCEQRAEMFAAMKDAGVDKYLDSQYWGVDQSSFDSYEDFDTFVTIMLDYTMDEDDSRWYNELKNTESPEEAAEIFLIHYERAIGGSDTIQYYAPYYGSYYQATDQRRTEARNWYEEFSR